MESRTKNKQSRAQIERMAARAFNGLGLAPGDDAIRELKEGWFNVAYAITFADGRTVILKIAPPPDAEVMQYERNIMATEVTSMRLVRQNPAIPVPEIYAYDDAHDLCNADYFFMEKLEGDLLEHVYAGLDPAVRTTVDRQIGAIMRAINGFPGSYFGYPGNPSLRAATWRAAFLRIVEAVLEDAARKNVVFDFTYDELRAAVARHAPALDAITTPCLVHWDAWHPNWFIQGDRVTGLLDFERALWAEPLMEAQFRQFGSDETGNGITDAGITDAGITDAMRGYGKDAFTPTEQQRMHLYTLHLALVMHVECFYRHYDTDDIFNMSRQFIAATMAWLQAN